MAFHYETQSHQELAALVCVPLGPQTLSRLCDSFGPLLPRASVSGH
jgi:hypothetical protein